MKRQTTATRSTAGLQVRIDLRAGSYYAQATEFVQQTHLAREGTALLTELRARLAALDDRYQNWVYAHIDPFFGQRRQEQQRDLQGDRVLQLSTPQKQANYEVGYGIKVQVIGEPDVQHPTPNTPPVRVGSWRFMEMETITIPVAHGAV